MNTFNIVSQRVIFLQTFPNERAVSADDGEHVAEVVRDAAGETSDRLHLLREIELFLQTTPLCDIPRDALNTDGCAILMDQPMAIFQRNAPTVL